MGILLDFNEFKARRMQRAREGTPPNPHLADIPGFTDFRSSAAAESAVVAPDPLLSIAMPKEVLCALVMRGTTPFIFIEDDSARDFPWPVQSEILDALQQLHLDLRKVWGA